MKGVDSHGCCKNYCENRITASAYMPDNDTTGGYVLHMAVGNGISYPVGDHLHYSSFRVWIRTGDRHRSGQDACGRFYTLYPACAFWLGSGVAGNIQNQIEEFINLTITEHMGKEYADWKLSQLSVTEPDEVEEEYKKVIATLPQEQEETITKYCDQIFNSGAETEEFFYRLGLRDGMKLRKTVIMVLKQLSE